MKKKILNRGGDEKRKTKKNMPIAYYGVIGTFKKVLVHAQTNMFPHGTARKLFSIGLTVFFVRRKGKLIQSLN